MAANSVSPMHPGRGFTRCKHAGDGCHCIRIDPQSTIGALMGHCNLNRRCSQINTSGAQESILHLENPLHCRGDIHKDPSVFCTASSLNFFDDGDAEIP